MTPIVSFSRKSEFDFNFIRYGLVSAESSCNSRKSKHHIEEVEHYC